MDPRVLGGDSVPDIIVSAGTGGQLTRILSGATLAELGAWFPFGAGFGASVRTAAGELSGDATADIVVAMGPGGGSCGSTTAPPLGRSQAAIPSIPSSLVVYRSPPGDVNGDGRADIIVGQAGGGGTVRVFSGTDIALLLSQTPFGAGYTGGLNVASGDVDGDGHADIIVGQARGGTVSIVRRHAADSAERRPYGDLRGGVFVAAGDVTGDGRAEVIAAPGTDNAPVLVYDAGAASVVTSLVPYASAPGGVRVAATDTTGDGRVEIVTVPGPGAAPRVARL